MRAIRPTTIAFIFGTVAFAGRTADALHAPFDGTGYTGAANTAKRGTVAARIGGEDAYRRCLEGRTS